MLRYCSWFLLICHGYCSNRSDGPRNRGLQRTPCMYERPPCVFIYSRAHIYSSNVLRTQMNLRRKAMIVSEMVDGRTRYPHIDQPSCYYPTSSANPTSSARPNTTPRQRGLL